MRMDLLVLNHNGRELLGECLPSVLRAAAASQHECAVTVIDNESTDDSVSFLSQHFPQVKIFACSNHGLCSFNDVLSHREAPIALLLNNDIKLDEGAIDPLVEPLLPGANAASTCFMTAPLCWRFDGRTYEGLKTAVRWRYGLVQATALFPGHERGMRQAGLTASAGAVLAVNRRIFLDLGGFDELYLPGRLEDLDFAFRGYQAGYHARYVPASVAYHRGAATFGKVFGDAGCDRLALRNTLLFQYKNLRHPLHVVRQLIGLPIRLLRECLQAPFVPPARRWLLCRALWAARARWREVHRHTPPLVHKHREREFFVRFHPRCIDRTATPNWA